MIRPSRGWRPSMATMRKYGRCFRPNFFMRIRTATAVSHSLSVIGASAARKRMFYGPLADVPTIRERSISYHRHENGELYVW